MLAVALFCQTDSSSAFDDVTTTTVPSASNNVSSLASDVDDDDDDALRRLIESSSAWPCDVSTCHARCGQTSTLSGPSCACDAACVVYNDCCHDYRTACPAEYRTTLDIITNKHRLLLEKSIFQTQSVIACVQYWTMSVATVGYCPDDVTACDLGVSQIADIPVRDNDTGVDFVNAKCARCNNVTNGQLWPFELSGAGCDIPEVQKNSDLEVTSLYEIIIAAAVGCELHVSSLPSAYHLCERVVDASCDVTCRNSDAVNRCYLHGVEPVIDRNSVPYRNRYCAFCSSDTDVSWSLQCRNPRPAFLIHGELPWHYDVALVYDASQPDGLALRCDDGFVYIDGDVGCEAKLSCPDGFIALSGECEQMDGSTSWATTDDDNGTNHAPQTVTSFAADGDTGATASLAARSMGHFLTLQSVLVFINTGLVLNRHQ